MQKFTHAEIHRRRNSHTTIHHFPHFRRHAENMNFRQGNQIITEIHEFPYFRRMFKT